MKFGLTGNPLGHSFSKIIHEELFKLKNKDYFYELYPTQDLDKLFRDTLSGLNGFNITIPYKTDVIKYLDNADEKVRLYNACNTVVNQNGKYYGYNTDVFGFLKTLKKCNIDLYGKKLLVLGSGGVSRMMAFEAALHNSEVYITSRNPKKCCEIKEEIYEKIGKKITVLKEINNNFDIVLNGTPCGMYPNELSLPIPFERIMNVPFIFDTIYNPKETLLTRLANYCGNCGENGLHMLVEQAAVAQELFCGLTYTPDEVDSVVEKIDIKPLSLNKNIVLIGPPGSGKSTIGAELADLLNLRFVDTDAEIVKKYGNITEIFKNNGEKYFRQLEVETIEKLSVEKNLLISTGGGIVENKDIMKKICDDDSNIVLFLNPHFDILLNRTSKNNDRPLLSGDTESKLKSLLDRRLPLYNRLCNVRLDILREQSEKLTVVQCIDKICSALT